MCFSYISTMNNNKEIEIWKDIVGFEGLYQVSNFGRVRNKNYQIKSNHKNMYGYVMVGLYKDGKTKVCFVHRLVANAFIPKPDNLYEVNHKDENKNNNRVENLEWCDRSYNINYGHRNEKTREKLLNHPTSSKVVLQYSLKGELINTFLSVEEAKRQLGFGNHIKDCCRDERPTAYGYIWKYADKQQ